MSQNPLPDVLIAGASTRAAAHSALRAGFRPLCADLFADADLRSVADIFPVAHYPRGLRGLRDIWPGVPWLYTGGLENNPELISWISETHPLWGNGPEPLALARDPRFVQSLLEHAGLPALAIWPSDVPPPRADGRWILKPHCGSGGRGISLWNSPGGNSHDQPSENQPSENRSLEANSPEAEHSATLREPHVFQEFRDGLPVSALYLSMPGETWLIGASRQLVGLEDWHAPPFAYCGSIAPLEIPTCLRQTFLKVGKTIAAGCRLRGLFGCDFVADDVPWLTEVNPRYPALAELFDHLLQSPLLDRHRQACQAFERFPSDSGQFQMLSGQFSAGGSPGLNGSLEPTGQLSTPQRRMGPYVLGKAILYAPADLRVDRPQRLIRHSTPWRLPLVADIPFGEGLVPRGTPVCTVFARGRDQAECLEKLTHRAIRFERRDFRLEK